MTPAKHIHFLMRNDGAAELQDSLLIRWLLCANPECPYDFSELSCRPERGCMFDAGVQMVRRTGLSFLSPEGWLDFESHESDLRGSRGVAIIGLLMQYMAFCNFHNTVRSCCTLILFVLAAMMRFLWMTSAV